ncbi:MAG: hypothetical protein KUG81_10025 [Gammaproteobacteria bacterium]|nr:hypothetical protein [Gammaproteobacteria bacterium]
MTNAKKELIEHIENRAVEYIHIALCGGYDVEPQRFKGCLEDIVDSLDFDYHSGYGGQNLFCYIWYKDGTWSERGEYDGSEWWEHQERPKLDVVVDV